MKKMLVFCLNGYQFINNITKLKRERGPYWDQIEKVIFKIVLKSIKELSKMVKKIFLQTQKGMRLRKCN